MAPPSTASGTVQSPIDQHEDEDDALKHQHGCIGQSQATLQQAAARADAAKQDRDGNDRERILSREEGDENAGEAVARREIGIGAALHGRDFDHTGKTRGATGKEADGEDQFADTEADDLGGADIATGNARGKAEHGVIDQDVGGDRGDQAEDEAPMHVGAGDRADHVRGADLTRRRLVETRGIPHHAFDEVIENRDRDVDEQQARYRLVDTAILP